MSKQKLLFRHLWRSLQLKQKLSNTRNYKEGPRDKPTNARLLRVVNEAMLLTVPAVTFGLGTWQVYRKQWKEGVIMGIQSKVGVSSPIPIPDCLTDLAGQDMEYISVCVTGEFDHSMEKFIYPRPNVQETDPSKVRGMGVTPSRGGMLVVTPFQLKDRKEKILINRGWIPVSDQDPSTRADGQIKGEVTLVGVVRLSEPAKSWLAESVVTIPAGSNIVIQRDVEKLAKELGTEPVYLDADSNSTVKGGPVGGQTIVSLRNEHMQYIATWYGICVVSLFLYVRRYRKPPQRLQTQLRHQQR